MRLIIFFLVIKGTLSINPRSVNLAIETSLLFDPKDVRRHETLINDIKVFLDKLHGVVSPLQLANFLRTLGKHLMKYDSEHLKDITNLLRRQLDIHYRGDLVFHEIITDSEKKTYLRNTVKEWSKQNPELLKAKIDKALKSKDRSVLSDFLNNMNSFYNANDTKHFENILKKLSKYPKGKNLKKVVKDTLNFIIFDRYEHLNDTEKVRFANEINNLLKNYVGNKFGSLNDYRKSNENKKTFIDTFIITTEKNKIEIKNKRKKHSRLTIDAASFENNVEKFLDNIQEEIKIINNIQ